MFSLVKTFLSRDHNAISPPVLYNGAFTSLKEINSNYFILFKVNLLMILPYVQDIQRIEIVSLRPTVNATRQEYKYTL